MENTNIHKVSPSRLLVFIPSGMKAIKGGSLYTVALEQNLGSVWPLHQEQEGSHHGGLVKMQFWFKQNSHVKRVGLSKC